MTDAPQTTPSPLGQLAQMLTGYRVTQMIVVAAKAGIADALAAGALGIDELAERVAVNSGALYRVMRALASLGIFRELDGRRFELTPLAEPLKSNAPQSLRTMAVSYGEAWWWNVWGQMFETVQTGEPAFNRVHGAGLFEYLEEHPDAARQFNAHMVAITELQARAVVKAHDFSGARRLCDVGGGHGAMLREILKAYPHIHGVLFDQPSVLAQAGGKLHEAGLRDRCTFVPGNFFESVPGGCDTYIMKSIIHDWLDDRALVILRNCRRAMSRGGTLLLIEQIVPPGNEPSIAKLTDMTMLMFTGGIERTGQEYRDLLAAAEFRLDSVVAADDGMSVMAASAS